MTTHMTPRAFSFGAAMFLAAFAHGEYFALGDVIGKFGFSVAKENRKPTGKKPHAKKPAKKK